MDVNIYGAIWYLQDFHSKGSLYIPKVFFMGKQRSLYINKKKINVNKVNKGVSFNKDYFTHLA